MSVANNRRKQLRDLYGFDFPDDLFRFWEFANRVRPLEPLNALEDLGLALVGPFDVLAGRFDRRESRYSQLLHWRYYNDPPEFFTALAGSIDGLHWGYYLDDPAEATGCVASYYARDAYEIAADGNTLFESVRLHLEMCYRDWSEDLKMGLEYADEEGVRRLDQFRPRFMNYPTGDRSETGAEYEECYPEIARASRVIAGTWEGMGVAAPGDTYRPLSKSDKLLWKYLEKVEDPEDVVDEARQALLDGYPATALKLGKDLWALGGERRTEYAYELLDAAYAALHRPVLQHVLRTHRAHRDLPSVDILENEDDV